MKNLFMLMRELAPKEVGELLQRFRVLQTIHILEPVGRRAVCLALGISERIVRCEGEKLKEQGLIEVSKKGMMVAEKGLELITGLEELLHHVSGIVHLEETIQRQLGAKQVFIIQGDCEREDSVYEEVTHFAAKILLRLISRESKIAIGGGAILSSVVESIPDFTIPQADYVVPVRGMIGNRMEKQADALAASLAKKLAVQYFPFRMPDFLSPHDFREMRTKPDIEMAVSAVHQANGMLIGIDNALEMAGCQNFSTEVYHYLVTKGAIAELLGYYFDTNGNILYGSQAVGLSLETMASMQWVLLVAAGARKAESILAVKKYLSNGIIIVDEGTAKEIIRLATHENMNYNK